MRPFVTDNSDVLSVDAFNLVLNNTTRGFFRRVDEAASGES